MKWLPTMSASTLAKDIINKPMLPDTLHLQCKNSCTVLATNSALRLWSHTSANTSSIQHTSPCNHKQTSSATTFTVLSGLHKTLHWLPECGKPESILLTYTRVITILQCVPLTHSFLQQRSPFFLCQTNLQYTIWRISFSNVNPKIWKCNTSQW